MAVVTIGTLARTSGANTDLFQLELKRTGSIGPHVHCRWFGQHCFCAIALASAEGEFIAEELRREIEWFAGRLDADAETSSPTVILRRHRRNPSLNPALLREKTANRRVPRNDRWAIWASRFLLPRCRTSNERPFDKLKTTIRQSAPFAKESPGRGHRTEQFNLRRKAVSLP